MKIFVFLFTLLCFTSSAFAIDLEVKKMEDFIVVTQKDGVSFSGTWAIRKSIISGVSVENAAGNYRIIITTSTCVSDSTKLIVKEYETKIGEQKTMQSAFDEIMKLLTEKE